MIDKSILLTVAIPTYNRAQLLNETIQSILPQITKDVELLICDNASEDSTETLMAQYCSQYSFIRYLKRESNQGIDANIHWCVQNAFGRYVHIMSDDDILLTGTINNLLEKIDRYPEAKFFFLNARIFSGSFSDNMSDPVFPSRSDILFHDKSEFIEFIWVWSTFVSSFVLERTTWCKVRAPEQYIGTDIYLSYMLFEHLCDSPEIIYISYPSIAIRAQYTGNYRIFYAFAYQWHKLLLERAIQLGYNSHVMKRVFKRSILCDLLPRIISIKSGSIKVNIDMQSLRYLFGSTRKYLRSWLLVYPVLIMPSLLARTYWKMVRILGIASNNTDNGNNRIPK